MTMNEVYYNTNNRVAKQHIEAYNNTHHYHLWDCYTNYSRNKEQAFKRCEELCDSLKGWGLRILSYNTMQFTVGFLFMDTQTGVIRFAYITRDYDRFCDYVVE